MVCSWPRAAPSRDLPKASYYCYFHGPRRILFMSHSSPLSETDARSSGAAAARRKRGADGPDFATMPIRVVVADGTRMGSQLIADALKEDPRFSALAVFIDSPLQADF